MDDETNDRCRARTIDHSSRISFNLGALSGYILEAEQALARGDAEGFLVCYGAIQRIVADLRKAIEGEGV